jgi:hypothetical protein
MTAARALPHAAAGHCTRDFRVLARSWGGGCCQGLCCAGRLFQCPTNHGEVKGEDFHSRELLQSDSNRMATLAMKENLESLFLIMDKLYRRNPAEWKKTASSREAAMTMCALPSWSASPGMNRTSAMWQRCPRPCSPRFAGDRVAAFVMLQPIC